MNDVRNLRNPVLLLVWGLPLVAVIASFLTLALALSDPDGELPEQYHWEGFRLDRDFARAEHARSLGVRGTLSRSAATDSCTLALRLGAPAPRSLTVILTHATRSDLDQQMQLHRLEGTAGTYRGTCRAAALGHWRLEVRDAAHAWSVRQSVHGSLETLSFDARPDRSD